MTVCAAPETVARSKVLADFSMALAAAINDERTLCQLVVERIGAITGDACVLRLLDEKGVFRSIAQHHEDQALLRRVRSVSLATQPDPAIGIWHTLLTGQRMVRYAISPDRLPPGLTREQVALFSKTPVTHLLGVPLVARGRASGALLIVRCIRTDPHRDDDVAFVLELAECAALALDNARLLTAERAARTRAEDAEDALRAELADRVCAEERRRQGDERLQLLIHSVVDYAIFLLDREGKIISWNEGAQRIFGWTESQVIDRHVSILAPQGRAEGSVATLLETAQASGRAGIEGWGLRADGTRFWGHTIVSTLGSTASGLTGYLVITRDLTATPQAEAAQSMNALLEARTRELAAANEELEAFSYSVSHDLRAPLRAIDGFSQALLTDYGHVLDETAAGHLRRVRAGVGRMRQLIDDMLQLSRSTRVALEPASVDLARIAREVESELRAREPTREVIVEIPDELPVRGDPRLLRIVMENLLGNARKFTRNQPAPRIVVTGTPGPDEVTVTVADNGAGFDMTYARRLFQPFQRLHSADEFEGTGIGLAIVKRIVHRHGGRVWAEGQTGAGASFHFTLPVRSAGELPSVEPPAEIPTESAS